MSEKIIRDPVHDVIAFRLSRPVDALLFKLLNAAEFQRLRRIRQLGMAALAYPGADHARYSHSLGVMETARKMLQRLGESFQIDDQQATTCLCAALLHDLGHGPFSHVFEQVSNVHHEELTHRVILDPSTDVNRILTDHDPALPQMIVDMINCRPVRTFLSDVLTSQLDADRLDYLLRDNLMTGSRYGNYDLRWLLQALTIDPKTNRLAVTAKGVSAVEAYLQSRYHMYRNVYFHKVVRAGEGMVKLALQLARRLAVQGRLTWPGEDNPVYKLLLGLRLETSEFTDLDDISVTHCFKLWAHGDEPTLASLCKGLLYRRLFKTIDLSHIDDPRRIERTVNAVADAVAKAGGDAGYDLFYDEPSDRPYETMPPSASAEPTEILVINPQGNSQDFATISPLVGALNRQLWFRRLHVAAEWREVAQKAVNGS